MLLSSAPLIIYIYSIVCIRRCFDTKSDDNASFSVRVRLAITVGSSRTLHLDSLLTAVGDGVVLLMFTSIGSTFLMKHAVPRNLVESRATCTVASWRGCY